MLLTKKSIHNIILTECLFENHFTVSTWANLTWNPPLPPFINHCQVYFIFGFNATPCPESFFPQHTLFAIFCNKHPSHMSFRKGAAIFTLSTYFYQYSNTWKSREFSSPPHPEVHYCKADMSIAWNLIGHRLVVLYKITMPDYTFLVFTQQLPTVDRTDGCFGTYKTHYKSNTPSAA